MNDEQTPIEDEDADISAAEIDADESPDEEESDAVLPPEAAEAG